MAITVQNKDFELLYQNARAREMLNRDNFYKTCYHRFLTYDDFGTEQCKDCPLQFTELDHRPHTILRKMYNSIQNDFEYFQITHQPILKEDDTFDHYIEIINEISPPKAQKILNLQNFVDIHEEVYCGLFNFGDLGGEIISLSSFDTFETEDPENIEALIHKLSQFWFIAIGQGDNWSNGLYGPLPVFDHLGYDSYALAFRKENPSQMDPRFGGFDLGILLLILRKNNSAFLSNRNKIYEFLNDYIGEFQTIADLRNLQLNDLKHLLIGKQRDNASI